MTGGSNCGLVAGVEWRVGGDGRWSRPGVRAGRYSACGLAFELVEHVEGFLDSGCGGLTRVLRSEALWLSFRDTRGKSCGSGERAWGSDSDGGFLVSGAASVGIGSSPESCLLWVDMWLSIPPPAPWSLMLREQEVSLVGYRKSGEWDDESGVSALEQS